MVAPTKIQISFPVRKVAVTEGPKGQMVVALAPIGQGETIFRIEGVRVARPSRYSIQVGADIHFEPGDGMDLEEPDRFIWRWLNHHCRPNAAVRDRSLVALRPIAAAEEITFDYNTTEYDMASPFECLCGAPDCAGFIRGFRHLDPSRREALRPSLAQHLLPYLELRPVASR